MGAQMCMTLCECAYRGMPVGECVYTSCNQVGHPTGSLPQKGSH